MLEEKIETLTKEVVALRQAIEKSGLGGAGKAAAAEEPKAKPKAKPKAAEPDHDADEVGAIMRKLAKRSEEDKLAVRKYIKKAGHADLADLLTSPAAFDAAFDWATEALEVEEETAEDDDDV